MLYNHEVDHIIAYGSLVVVYYSTVSTLVQLVESASSTSALNLARWLEHGTAEVCAEEEQLCISTSASHPYRLACQLDWSSVGSNDSKGAITGEKRVWGSAPSSARLLSVKK